MIVEKKEITKISFKDFFTLLIFPYFKSSEKKIAITLLGTCLLISVAMVFFNVLINEWSGRFYDALQNADQKNFIKEALNFPKLVSCMVLIFVTRVMIKGLVAQIKNLVYFSFPQN
jgi:ABC-type uncharacterized transport system fused permease/ATPase subunit